MNRISDTPLPLYLLGPQPGFRSMSFFHALARSGGEGLVVTTPAEPYVSVGYFDDTAAAIDLDYCRSNNIGVIRREIGGGPVLLDKGQLFYQLVLRLGRAELPGGVMPAYEKFSKAPIAAYKKLGIPVTFRPINDLVTEKGQKISGQGAANIGSCFVFVGSLLLNFDVVLMSRVLKLQDEKFRDKVANTMAEHLSWAEKELGRPVGEGEAEEALLEGFAPFFSSFEPAVPDSALLEKADEISGELTSDEALFMETTKTHPAIKIKEGLFLRQGVHTARGGLIRAQVEIGPGNRISRLRLSGDFTFLPKEGFAGLQEAICGAPFSFEAVCEQATRYLSKGGIDCPGVTPADFAQAIAGATSSS